MTSISVPDFIDGLGVLALGSRMRRLSDRLMSASKQLYSEAGFDFEPRWFPLFRLLAERSSISVGEAAQEMRLSHARVSQLATAMARRGWVDTVRDAADERRRLLSLSPDGRALCERLTPLWGDIDASMRDVVDEVGIDVLAVLDGIEHALDAGALDRRVAERRRSRWRDAVEIVPYRPEYRDAFRRLNLEWIEALFEIEPYEVDQLADPEAHVLADGGHLLFAKIGDEIVGTCGLMRQEGAFELVKMAVTPSVQGRGVGRLLLERALEVAREAGVERVTLVTNSGLRPAVSLYRRFGFRVVSTEPSPKYKRGDLTMELELR